MAGVIVIGAGQAAMQLAMSLRSMGDQRPITLIGDEAHAPYSRPPLSKSFLKGDTQQEDLFFRPGSWFTEQDVSLRLGRAVLSVDRKLCRVALQDEVLEYDSLVFATGTRPRELPALAAFPDNVVTLRGIDDMHRLLKILPACGQVAVIGGGFIGLEFASVMRSMGRAVTVIEAAPRLMARAVSPAISKWFADLHRRHGVRLVLGTGVRSASGAQGKVTALETDQGEVIAADLVVAGIGVLPNVDLARAAGLTCDNGIVVDDTLRTEDPKVFAIGDCAAFPLPDGRRIRLESVQNAVDQAKHLARVLTGDTSSYETTPWFWSDQYDVKLQIAGLLREDASAQISSGEPPFSVDHLVGDQLICRESINDARAHLQARKKIGKPAANAA